MHRKVVIEILASMAVNLLLHEVQYDSNSFSLCLYLTRAIVVLENYDGGDDFRYVIHRPSIALKYRDLSRRDMLKMLSNRTSCSCLKGMYAHARRTQPKLGTCSNCKQQKGRKSLMLCGGCRIDQYCCSGCQAEHWENHKTSCAAFARMQNDTRS